MSGFAYSAQDDCDYLEEQAEKRNRGCSVYNQHPDIQKSGVVSQISWDRIQQALKDAGIIREGEIVHAFTATAEGLKISFGEYK